MKIKFDFWVTPDGYTGKGPLVAQRVKGSAEIPVAPLLAILAALMSDKVSFKDLALERAVELLDAAMNETQDG